MMWLFVTIIVFAILICLFFRCDYEDEREFHKTITTEKHLDSIWNKINDNLN